MELLAEEQYRHFLINLIENKGAHANIRNALIGLTPKIVSRRLEGFPHTIWQLLGHINYWQQFIVDSLKGLSPKQPKTAAETWQDDEVEPTQAMIDEAYQQFIHSLNEVKTLLHQLEDFEEWEHLRIMASHISYHIGQVVLLRQVFGDWHADALGLSW